MVLAGLLLGPDQPAIRLAAGSVLEGGERGVRASASCDSGQKDDDDDDSDPRLAQTEPTDRRSGLGTGSSGGLVPERQIVRVPLGYGGNGMK